MHRGDSKRQPGYSGAPKTCEQKAYFDDDGEGWLQLHFFSVDFNTKSICPNPQGQSGHITKFPLAGILKGAPSERSLSRCTAKVEAVGKGLCPRTFLGGV